MKRREKIALLLAHILAAFLSFLFLTMASELGFGLRQVLRGLSKNLAMIGVCALPEYGLVLYCGMVLVFNVGAAIVAWRTVDDALARVTAVTGAVLELVFAIFVFAVAVYAYLFAGMPL